MQKEVALDEKKAQLVRLRVSLPELEPEPTEDEIKQARAAPCPTWPAAQYRVPNATCPMSRALSKFACSAVA